MEALLTHLVRILDKLSEAYAAVLQAEVSLIDAQAAYRLKEAAWLWSDKGFVVAITMGTLGCLAVILFRFLFKD